MKCVIVIDGHSADSLFAVGGTDLKDFFLKEKLGVNPNDVVKIHFEEIRRNGKIITMHEAVWGKGNYDVITSKDNYERANPDDASEPPRPAVSHGGKGGASPPEV